MSFSSDSSPLLSVVFVFGCGLAVLPGFRFSELVVPHEVAISVGTWEEVIIVTSYSIILPGSFNIVL